MVGGWSELGWVGSVPTTVSMQFEVGWIGSRGYIRVGCGLDSSAKIWRTEPLPPGSVGPARGSQTASVPQSRPRRKSWLRPPPRAGGAPPPRPTPPTAACSSGLIQGRSTSSGPWPEGRVQEGRAATSAWPRAQAPSGCLHPAAHEGGREARPPPHALTAGLKKIRWWVEEDKVEKKIKKK